MRVIASGFLAASVLTSLGASGMPNPAGPELTAEERAQMAAIERERRKEHDEAVAKALAEYRKLLGESKSPGERAAAVARLGEDEKDSRIVTELTSRLTDAEPVREQAILAKSGMNMGLFYNSEGQFVGQHVTNDSKTQFAFSSPFPPGAFHHVAMAVDKPAGVQRLYVDGRPAGEARWKAGTSAYAYGKTPWQIGFVDHKNPQHRHTAIGTIADVHLYNRALGPAEIEALFKAGGGVASMHAPDPGAVAGPPPPIGRWKPQEHTAEDKAQLAAIEKENQKRHDEAVQKVLDQFRNDLREAKVPGERAVTIRKLREDSERDPRIVAELARCLSEAAAARAEALAALGAYRGDERAAQALIRAMPASERDPVMLEKNLQALAAVGHLSAASILVKYSRDPDAKRAAVAIGGLGGVHAAAVVEALIVVWEEIEHEMKKGGNAKKAAEERLNILKLPLRGALCNVTKQGFTSCQEYRLWWIQHRSKYKPPVKPATVYCLRHFARAWPSDRPLPAGAVAHELWTGIPGNAIRDLTKANVLDAPPHATILLTELDIPTNIIDNYGSRIRGYLHPPADGAYTFWLAADDQAELHFSSDESPANAVILCRVTGATGYRDWDARPEQKSAPLALQAGRRYFVEILHKQGAGDQHLSVAWSPPGGAREVIAGKYLSPHGPPKEIAGATPLSRPDAEGFIFYRAVNFNGPAVNIDGTAWESSAEAPNCLLYGRPIDVPNAILNPAADGDKARMLRTAIAHVGTTFMLLGRVPKGTYKVSLYVSGNGSSDLFSVSLKGTLVATNRSGGAPGRWERLGPWNVEVVDGALDLVCSGGPVNLCGIEVWRSP